MTRREQQTDTTNRQRSFCAATVGDLALIRRAGRDGWIMGEVQSVTPEGRVVRTQDREGRVHTVGGGDQVRVASMRRLNKMRAFDVWLGGRLVYETEEDAREVLMGCLDE